jgi:hypothetical protein
MVFYCRNCGKQIQESAASCPDCGALQRTPESASSAGLKYVLPIGRSGWAIAAGYLGLFAILVVPAPLALGCGILGLRDISRNPKKIGKPRAIFGIVMGGLGSALLAYLILRRYVH